MTRYTFVGVARQAQAILDDQTLLSGTSFYGAHKGVAVTISPLTPEESDGEADHELTISTGFPPDPDRLRGLPIDLSRHEPGGWTREPLGVTDQFGSLIFRAGPRGQSYRLTANEPGLADKPTLAQRNRPDAVDGDSTASPRHPPIASRAQELAWSVGWFKREEFPLAADTLPGWTAVAPGPITLGVTPVDPGLCFRFPDVPTAIAYGAARSREGHVFHDVFPLRPTADGGAWEGRMHLPGDGAWQELRVEPLTPAVVAGLAPDVRRTIAARLDVRLQDWGNDSPRDGHGPRYRELWTSLVAALVEPRREAGAMTCPVCRAWSDGWTAKLTGLREGMAASAPVCRTHLSGSENVVLAAARDAWHRKTAEAFEGCAELLTAFLDEQSPVRRSFLHPYPLDLRDRAIHQAAGILATIVALGHWQKNEDDLATDKGADAALHLQAAVGLDGTRRKDFAGWLTPAKKHPLTGLWVRTSTRLNGDAAEGFLAFRQLTVAITRQDDDSPPFTLLRDRPVVVRPLLYDRERSTGLLARLEFVPVAEGCGELYVDVAPLGFRVLDPSFLRAVEGAWRAVHLAMSRESPGTAVRLRIVVGDDASPSPALHGSSCGIAIGCGLLALARGDLLDKDVAITGELLPFDSGGEFEKTGAGWTGHVLEKLAAARVRGLSRAIVGVVEEGIRYPGRLDQEPRPEFEVVPVRSLVEAYAALRRGPFVAVSQLVDDARRAAILQEWITPLLASGLRALATPVMRHLISAYRLLQLSAGEDYAQRLVTEFEASLTTHGITIALDQHREILEALRYGLPHKPPHVPHLEISLAELLTRPGYPALMRAIRASEIDPPRAVREFEELLRQQTFQSSAFVWYLSGQAFRKEKLLWQALVALEQALTLIDSGADATPDEIRLEVLRGLGAVCRKIAGTKLDRVLVGQPANDDGGTWQEFKNRAEGYFRAGEPLIRRLPGSRLATASDFYHSYGYFYLQFGFMEWRLGQRKNVSDYKEALRLAEAYFALSAKCDPNWGAPEARLQFVRHKLLQLGEVTARAGLESGYLRARAMTAAEAKNKPEAGLTEILCLCGQLLLGSAESARLQPARIRENLIDALCRRIESRGARECHKFDLDFLRDGLGGDVLGEVVELFKEAARWDDLEYARFTFAQARSGLLNGTADRTTVAKRVENARKLVADYVHENPGHVAATDLRAALERWLGTMKS